MKKYILILFLALAFQSMAQKITPEWLWSLGRVSLVDISEKNNTILYSVRHYDINDNSGHTTMYRMDINGKNAQVFSTPEGSHGLKFHPTLDKITYLTGDGLYMMDIDGSNSQLLSSEAMDDYIISPNGSDVAYIRDVKYKETLMDKYSSFKKANAYLFDDLMYRHWDHWEDDKASNLFIQNIASGQAMNITEGPFDTPLKPFGGMSEISWNHDGRAIYYTIKKLLGKEYAESTNSDIYKYDLATQKTSNITASNKGYDRDPVCSSDGKWLAFNRMTTPGYEADKNLAILVNQQTGAESVLNQNIDMNANHPVFSEDGKTIYFTAGVEATTQLFSYDMRSKKITQITEGVHNIYDFIPVSNGVVARIASMTDAHEIYHISNTGNIKALTHVNKEQYSKVDKAIVKHKWVTTTDNKKMKVWYILPPDFDPNKKYPTLLYLQGGPQSAVSQFFSYRWNFQIMAAQGYVVVAPNRRGLPSFGEEWNKQISKDWGGQAMKDYLSAIDDAIANEPYVDKNRVGAVGASFGGYSAYWLAGNHEGRFSTFISHCGMFNMESWYGTTEELFFANYDLGGPYWEKQWKKSYEAFSPHTYADNWDTPILVIHGGKDFRVPVSEGMQAFQLAQIKGIKSKFLYFPEEGHWILSPQNGIIWQHEFFNWLDETLKNKDTSK